MTLLCIEHLSVFYSDNGSSYEAVKDVSFSLAAQESLAIIGESGCGKSSLMGALLPPQARKEKRITGQILYKEKPLQADTQHSIAFIFQDPLLALNPTMRIGHQLTESLFLQQKSSKKAAKKEALSLLEEVYLTNAEKIFDSYPHEVSRGMLQRVTIAMALAQKADLIAADEPTTALDITTNNQILALLRTLQKNRGFSLLLISHHLALVSEMCPRTLVMHQGAIIEEGSTKELFFSPKHPQTQRLIESAHLFSQTQGSL
jgi:ABC-type dipeptide/oligopeptide/nickel transport system ATPase component